MKTDGACVRKCSHVLKKTTTSHAGRPTHRQVFLFALTQTPNKLHPISRINTLTRRAETPTPCLRAMLVPHSADQVCRLNTHTHTHTCMHTNPRTHPPSQGRRFKILPEPRQPSPHFQSLPCSQSGGLKAAPFQSADCLGAFTTLHGGLEESPHVLQGIICQYKLYERLIILQCSVGNKVTYWSPGGQRNAHGSERCMVTLDCIFVLKKN